MGCGSARQKEDINSMNDALKILEIEEDYLGDLIESDNFNKETQAQQYENLLKTNDCIKEVHLIVIDLPNDSTKTNNNNVDTQAYLDTINFILEDYKKIKDDNFNDPSLLILFKEKVEQLSTQFNNENNNLNNNNSNN